MVLLESRPMPQSASRKDELLEAWFSEPDKKDFESHLLSLQPGLQSS
jgi:hypothetical protein